MKELSRSVRQAKQAKFWDADRTCPYSPYGDVAGPYDHTVMMWQLLVGWLLANWMLTRVLLAANGMRTHGPMIGCHVSLVGWLIMAM